MPMTTCRYPKCSGETENVICWNCQLGLRKTLIDLRGYIEDLHDQITRQTRNAAGQEIGKSTEEPLPFDLNASNALDTVNTALMSWVDPPAGADKYAGAYAMIDELLGTIPRIATTETAPALIDDMRRVARIAEKAVDRKSGGVMLGVCPCGRPVHANPEREWYRCRCDRLFSVVATRERLQELGRDQLVTAQDAEKLGELRGQRLRAKTVTQWRRRGKVRCRLAYLEDDSCDHPGQEHRFRFGDLLSLLPAPSGEGENPPR
ncbi:hypothetical protein [Nocardia nova]|uniref:hypothetical protein n=1 Tax=Nocardia nova TaxID=37330 RepID=UPI00273998BD|nr:hypothetical protein [Nocardia nova]